MDRLVEMNVEEFQRRGLELAVGYIQRMGQAINQAWTGRLFDDCEMEVKYLGDQMKRDLMQLGAQMRIDSSESSFSPSGG